MSKELNHKFAFKLIVYSGFLFMTISTILFYQNLYVASTNPEYLVKVYFNQYGEGTIELILFSCFIPFIIFTFVMMSKDVAEVIALKKEQKKDGNRNKNKIDKS